MKAEEQEKRNRSLRNSFIDGIFASGMIGFTQDYFTPFLLFIGGSVREVGLLTSLPNVIASLLQLKTADLMGLFRSRKRMITSFVLLQGLSMCAIALTVLAGIRSTTLFLGLVILFTSFGAIATPAWGSLMSDLVPEGMRGSYFGWRNSVLGLIIVASSACAGLVLQLTRKSDLAIGFTAVFSLAFLFRLLSWSFLSRMYDPESSHAGGIGVSLSNFIDRLKGSNFARFVLFVSLLSFSVNLASPYFAVLMLRDLKFGYLTYTVIMITANLTMYLLMGRWGRHADAVGNVRVLRFTGYIIAVIPLLWIVNRNPFFLVAAQVVSGFAWAGFNLCASNFIYDAVAPERRVRYISYFNVLNGLMISAGALIGGFLAQLLPPLLDHRILTLFAVSSAARILVCLFPFRLREVRTVKSVTSNRLFFSMIGIGPHLGIAQKTIRYLR